MNNMGQAVRALTIGGAVIDTIVQIAPERIEHMTMRNAHAAFLLVETGHKVVAENITQHVGGGAVNAAVSMARLGLDTATIVKLGDDINGKEVCRELGVAKVDCQYLLPNAPLATGTSVLISSHEHNAAIFTMRGANTLLRCEDLAQAAFDGRQLVYVASLSDGSADCFSDILAQAKSCGAMTVANPGIRQLSSRAAPFLDSLPNLDILAINRTEAEQVMPHLVSRGLHNQKVKIPAIAGDTDSLLVTGLHGGGFEMGFAAFVKGMTELGVDTLLITNGQKGSYACTRDGIWHCPIAKVQVAGTVGAGDAFNSTFAAMRASGLAVPDALQMATINAASVVSYIDTQTGLLSRPAINGWLDENEDKFPITQWLF